jgi:hypothetical protein
MWEGSLILLNARLKERMSYVCEVRDGMDFPRFFTVLIMFIFVTIVTLVTTITLNILATLVAFDMVTIFPL